MPSSHTSLHFHLVFSTKERLPIITKEWRDRLHAYLGGLVKGLEGVPLVVGGVEDHVHLLVGLKSSHRLDYFLRDLKADSSEWVHKEIGKRMFGWQKGYGAFSVSPSNIEGVKRYVLNQEEHHQRKTFQEEYVELLKASGIEYDEQYLWWILWRIFNAPNFILDGSRRFTSGYPLIRVCRRGREQSVLPA